VVFCFFSQTTESQAKLQIGAQEIDFCLLAPFQNRVSIAPAFHSGLDKPLV
jgi:hypothetical protein